MFTGIAEWSMKTIQSFQLSRLQRVNGSFFLTNLIWGRFFSELIHETLHLYIIMVKLHLQHMHMIFVEC